MFTRFSLESNINKNTEFICTGHMHCLFICVIDTVHERFGHSTLSIELLIKKIRNARASLGYFLDVFIHNCIHSYMGFTVIKTSTFSCQFDNVG